MTLAVDVSALLAILLHEADHHVLQSKLAAADKIVISPVNWWEVNAVLQTRHGEAVRKKASRWMEAAGIAVDPTTADQASIALDAFAQYGGRPARLNLGDCFAYSLAKSRNIPLLYKGNDFAQTDVDPA